MSKRILIIVVLAAFAVCAVAVAQQRKAIDEARFGTVEVKRTQSHVMRPARMLVIPWHVNYQGYLTDDAGNPINDTLSMTFGIWDDPSAGTELWNENGNVVVEEGLFNVVLGSTTPIPPDVFGAGQSRWLELTIVAQTLSPRTEITSVGYAYRAVKADSADDADMVDGFDASATPGAGDLFPLSAGDVQYVNEGQTDAVTSDMIVDGTIARADAEAAFKAPYADTADYAFAAPVIPDSDWTISGSNMYSAVSGSVGIGTSTPSVKLDVDGDFVVSGYAGVAGDAAIVGEAYLYGGIYLDSTFRVSGDPGTSGQLLQSTGIGVDWVDQSAIDDNDWTITGTVLHPSSSYGLAMRSFNVLYGVYDTTHVNLGIACTTGTSGQDRAFCTVSGGYNNSASYDYAAVGGGSGNMASGYHGTVSGGEKSSAIGQYAVVGGGRDNTASGNGAAIGGGGLNAVNGDWAAVGGGWDNAAAGNLATVGGGEQNTADSGHATVAGGLNNAAGTRATVAGGQDNDASGTYATVCGGYYNIASGYRAFIGGGFEHLALGDYATVGGGHADTASGDYATVGGGGINTATASYATVAGGDSNNAGGTGASVGGGRDNTASQLCTTIGGGQDNTASDLYTTVCGGLNNTASGFGATVGGGWNNIASGYYATVAGGEADTVTGWHSFAAGRQVRVTADYTFGFGRNFTTSTANAVIFYHSPGPVRVGIGNTAPTHLLDVGTNGAYCNGFTWVDGSSREYKEQIVELSSEEAIEAVSRLTPVRYNYKSDKDETFVGFIAEDVPDLVATKDRKGVSPMDIVAVLTKVVQNQQEEIESLRKEIDALKQ